MSRKSTEGKEINRDNLEEILNEGAAPSDALSGAESAPTPEDRVAGLEQEVRTLKEQSDRYRDEVLRKAADFENFRKQKERESIMAPVRALENVIRELLPVIDDIQRLLDHAPQSSESSGETKPFIEGVELVKKNLDKWLADKGVKQIESKGLKLDVNFHEAISQIDHPDAEPETIIEEYQTGYLLGERVIRHAKVIVAK